MKPDLLLAIDLAPRSRALLEAAYTVHDAKTPDARAEAARQHGDRIRAILTNGVTIISSELLEALPKVGIICAQGVGYEGIDLPAAKARGIMVTHGPGTNAPSVADHAMALMLAALRDLPANDAMVRAGRWRDGNTMRPMATGRKLGILGLGQIGALIARRAAAFDMPVRYHTRTARPDSGLDYVPSLMELATWADVLMIAVPGGATTRHLVNAKVLAALGPDGFVVNIGRGSVIDTTALVTALKSGGIAGAALDVIDGEPHVPEGLRALRNVVLTPHMGGRSPEAVQATINLVLSNLEAFFAGRPALTPVAEMTQAM